MPFTESKRFCREPNHGEINGMCDLTKAFEPKLLEYVLQKSEQGNLDMVIDAIDHFCE